MHFFKINSNLIKNFKNLDYINKPFSDKNTLKNWKKIGHNYEKYTGLMIDESQNIFDWCLNIKKEVPLKKATCTLYCMLPGTILPEHSDTFVKYRELMNLGKKDNIGRVVIFLENWKSGHYFEINQNPVVSWKKGDCILWENDTPHMAANLGKENRYTMQITGIYEK